MMTVLRLLPNDSTELTCIRLADVDYVEIEGRKIVYHVGNEKYRHISTLSELEEHLADQGFEILDKTNLVNINRVADFDETQGKVYFQEGNKYATVALIKQKMIRKEKAQSSSSHIRDILNRIRTARLKNV